MPESLNFSTDLVSSARMTEDSPTFRLLMIEDELDVASLSRTSIELHEDGNVIDCQYHPLVCLHFHLAEKKANQG